MVDVFFYDELRYKGDNTEYISLITIIVVISKWLNLILFHIFFSNK